MSRNVVEQTLDARGLICPLPVLKARKLLQTLPPGAILHVLVTDAAAPKDFELFCAEAGHVLQSITPQTGAIDVTVIRGTL